MSGTGSPQAQACVKQEHGLECPQRLVDTPGAGGGDSMGDRPEQQSEARFIKSRTQKFQINNLYVLLAGRDCVWSLANGC